MKPQIIQSPFNIKNEQEEEKDDISYQESTPSPYQSSIKMHNDANNDGIVFLYKVM